MQASIAILQVEATTQETTGGIAEGAGQAIQEVPKETGTLLGVVGDFFASIAGYLTSTQFVANVVATVAVIILATVLYRVVVRLLPRILQWHRPDTGARDAAARARIKRRDTALTLISNTLRFVTFIVVALFVLSIFLRDVLPTIAGATILAAIIGFGARDFLRDIMAGFFILFEEQYRYNLRTKKLRDVSSKGLKRHRKVTSFS